jgi:hypothetical protein
MKAPRARRFRVPHILSDSNVASLVQSSFRKQSVMGTPSSSSVWDWENFYPSSPSDSKFFKRRKADMEEANRLHELEEEEKVRAYLHHPHPHNLIEEDEINDDEGEEDEKEGVHCGRWEDDEEQYVQDHLGDGEDGEMGTRSECGFTARSECGYMTRSEYGGTAPSEYATVQLPLRRDERSEAGNSSSTVTAVIEMGMVVSELLGASRAQLGPNFQQLKSSCLKNQNAAMSNGHNLLQ